MVMRSRIRVAPRDSYFRQLGLDGRRSGPVWSGLVWSSPDRMGVAHKRHGWAMSCAEHVVFCKGRAPRPGVPMIRFLPSIHPHSSDSAS